MAIALTGNPLVLDRNDLRDLFMQNPVMQGRTTILHGPPGTGKSSLAEELAQKTGRAVYWLACHPDATANDVVGGWTPKPDGSGGWQFTPGPMLMAWGLTGNPGVLIVDDIHEAGPGIRAALYTAMNITAQYTTPDGITHSPHPDYWCIATSNESPDALPFPIVDRAGIRAAVLCPSQDMLDALNPDIRDLVEIDYDGLTDNPVATYREWRTMSDLWPAIGLGRAILFALGSRERAERMLESLTNCGIADAAAAYAIVVASKP
jgi:hypothetical protein